MINSTITIVDEGTYKEGLETGVGIRTLKSGKLVLETYNDQHELINSNAGMHAYVASSVNLF
jgi:hypothetical protein